MRAVVLLTRWELGFLLLFIVIVFGFPTKGQPREMAQHVSVGTRVQTARIHINLGMVVYGYNPCLQATYPLVNPVSNNVESEG